MGHCRQIASGGPGGHRARSAPDVSAPFERPREEPSDALRHRKPSWIGKCERGPFHRQPFQIRALFLDDPPPNTDLRSVNAQIEFLLREALKARGVRVEQPADDEQGGEN